MAYFQAFFDHFLLYSAALVFTISLVVFVHELGHYLSARLFGVRVKKFSIGFGREIWGFTGSHNTRWSLSLFPLGGYVELFGYSSAAEPKLWDPDLKALRDFTSDEKKEAFCFKPLWQRIVIVAMGPIANFLFALLILAAMYMISGEGSTKPVIYAVAKESPADLAGLKPLDEITKLNGHDFDRFEDIWAQSRVPGTGLSLTIKRGAEVLEFDLTSTPIQYIDDKGIAREHGRLGATNFSGVKLEEILAVDGIRTDGDIQQNRALLLERMGQEFAIDVKFVNQEEEAFVIYPVQDMNKALLDPDDKNYDFLVLRHEKEEFYLRHNFPDALWYAGARIYLFIAEALRFLHIVFFGSPPDDAEKIGGIVKMGEITGTAIDNGWYTFFMLIAVFSVQIGFINLLPVPALDGGYLLFFFYEAIRRRPLPEKIQDYALSIGLLLLIGLMLVANINDILNLSGF
ncbi:MAG: RIP metalloprotease RseP [Alphaproteobacteria bacterium]